MVHGKLYRVLSHREVQLTAKVNVLKQTKRPMNSYKCASLLKFTVRHKITEI